MDGMNRTYFISECNTEHYCFTQVYWQDDKCALSGAFRYYAMLMILADKYCHSGLMITCLYIPSSIRCNYYLVPLQIMLILYVCLLIPHPISAYMKPNDTYCHFLNFIHATYYTIMIDIYRFTYYMAARNKMGYPAVLNISMIFLCHAKVTKYAIYEGPATHLGLYNALAWRYYDFVELLALFH